ncbi:hypothetical protein ACFFUB_08330 [Algimonas porphyrae]|uniref:Uncharacterized protein n=1 Tax=Algimonas porphyrae TaxID=1128113 RepID=A0ABQ5V505_9PROT|nr:hypothetical protein [Algimonas porphyrae]GLQ22052.1 hypothetical protein GCM10007854_30070 [Algimonas porphyrae]
MLKLTRLSASSLALLIALFTGSANGQDVTFDVDAKNPAVEAELTKTEEEMADFFEDAEAAEIAPAEFSPAPELSLRDEAELLDRADQEASEFNDIDADDLAAIDRKRPTDAEPRLEKPGQVEKDFPLTCPLGTEAQTDGTCLAGPDYRIED